MQYSERDLMIALQEGTTQLWPDLLDKQVSVAARVKMFTPNVIEFGNVEQVSAGVLSEAYKELRERGRVIFNEGYKTYQFNGYDGYLLHSKTHDELAQQVVNLQVV